MSTRLPRRRAAWLAWLLCAASLAIIVRAARIQIVAHDIWTERARSQIVREATIPAVRGAIFDRNGEAIALSGVRYEIGIAPKEIPDSLRSDHTVRLAAATGRTVAEIRRMVFSDTGWKVLPGRYPADVRDLLEGMAGVHFTPVIRRSHPNGTSSLSLVGRVQIDGTPGGGLEATLDSVLAGRSGLQTLHRDVRGRIREHDGRPDREAVPGGDVWLTLDADLQQLASEILDDQIAAAGAESGDLVIVAPATGDVLALVGRTRDGRSTLSPATSPYEPGSIMKPFAYASLIESSGFRMSDSVHAEMGSAVVDGRSISDVHGYGWLTYSEALAVSSNIALLKAIRALDPQTQYKILDMLGFGAGNRLPAARDAAGRLRPPDEWSKFSRGSLAIGYEINATPLQLAMAYAAFATGGLVMEPRLVQRIRRHGEAPVDIPPIVRGQAFRSDVAEEILRELRSVVDEGSGRSAALGPFSVAGKTGTSRAWGKRGYDGHYASFAALFPAEQPQLVLVVRIARPANGVYYGGAVAAPVIRRVLESLLSSANPVVRRGTLVQHSIPATMLARPEAERPLPWSRLPVTGLFRQRPSGPRP